MVFYTKPPTFANPYSACRSFCEINHKIQGYPQLTRKPVDKPPT